MGAARNGIGDFLGGEILYMISLEPRDEVGKYVGVIVVL